MAERRTPPKPAEPAKPSLRERKKRETRQRISDVATLLFAARGFDEVPVSEVAEAANVSTMTVFNHFPRKEDLFLDRIPEALELFTSAVEQCGPDGEPLAAVRALVLRLVDEGHPFGSVGNRFADFWHVVAASSALRARLREGVEELEDALAASIGDTFPDAFPDPRLAATLIVSAYRSVCATTLRAQLAGARAEAVEADHRERMNAAFDMLERALRPSGGDQPLSPGPPPPATTTPGTA